MALTILVVDDSSSIRAVIRIALSRAGYEVLEADDGETAVKLLDGRRIDFIVSDVNMPIMDGLTFVSHVRASPGYRFTPIAMITTESSDEVRLEGKRLRWMSSDQGEGNHPPNRQRSGYRAGARRRSATIARHPRCMEK